MWDEDTCQERAIGRKAVLRRTGHAWSGFTATMAISMAMPKSDVPFLAVGTGLRLVQFGVLVGIWRSLPHDKLAASGVTVGALLTYSAIAQIAGPLLNPKTTLAAHVANGTIAVRLLWPLGVVSQFVAEMLGAALPAVVLSLVGISIAAALLEVPLAPTGAPLFFGLSLILGITVGVAVDFWFALLTVRLRYSVWFVASIRTTLTSVFSGALIPLSLMPWHIGDVLNVLPFAAMASGPLRVYTQQTGAAPLLVSQAMWAALLWFGLVWAVRKSRDKVVGVGG